MYHDDMFGFKVGFEKPNAANCIGLQLRRYYDNALLMTKLANGLKPYGIGTVGYETSSADDDYRPSQAFVGIGAGVKYDVGNNFNVFIETRALKSLESEDVAIATTLGVGYMFDMAPLQEEEIVKKELPKREVKRTIKLRPVRVEPTMPTYTSKPTVNVYQDKKAYIAPQNIRVKPVALEGMYYVQVAALTSTSPQPTMRKLRSQGVKNVSVKKERRGKVNYSFVVVGPYHDRVSATQTLGRLKAIAPGAYIKKF